MKQKLTLLLFLAFLLGMFSMIWADTVQVGSGTSTSSYLPIYGYMGYTYSQQIYTQAQINKAGNITKLRFYYVSGTITNSKDWVIYMGHTSKTTFSSTTDWEPLANLTQVFAGDVTSLVPLANNWMEITLTTPFNYNNTSNLIVAVDENTSGYGSMSWGAFTSGANTGIYYANDTTNPDPASPPTATSRTGTINRIQFVFPNSAAPLAPTLTYPANGAWALTGDKLYWTPTAGVSDATGYDVYFGTSATPPLVSSNQSAASYTPTLAAGTTYYWNVVAKNEIGDSSPSSTWSFKVPTATQIVESFESTTFPPSGWANPGSWTRSTSTYYHGVASAYKNPYDSAKYILSTPKVTITATSNLSLMSYCSTTSTSAVWDVVYSPDRVTWTQVTGSSFTHPTASVWVQRSIDLSSLAGNNYYLGIRAGGYSYASYYIDKVIGPEITPEAPGTPVLGTPADLATDVNELATFTWTPPTNGGVSTGYRLYVGTTNPPTSLVNDGNVLTYTLTTPLTYGGTYYWTVEAYNGAGTGAQATPRRFTVRENPTLVPPTTQDFTTFPPLNWTRYSGLLADPSTLTTTTSGWTADGFGNVGYTGATSLNIYGTTCKYWLVTPPIDLGSSKISGYNLSFDLALTAYGVTTAPTGTQADDKFAVVISTDNGATWSSANTLRLWDNAGSPYVYNEISLTGQTITIPLSGYSGVVKIGFYGESTVTSNGDNDLFIDNFAIVEAGAPPTPPTSSIPANGATSVAINTNLSWGGATGEPTGYKVYLGTDSENQDLVANVPVPTYDPESNFDFGATYYWKVDAYSDAGSSSDAGPLTVWTFSTYSGLAITPSPSNAATAQDATNKLLNWADVAGATGYRVKVGTSSGANDLVNMVEVAESKYTHSANWPFSQQIFWTVYTLNGEQVVDGTEWTFTTAADPTRPLPYLENFNASTNLPANWTGTFSVSATHGAASSNGLYKNLYSYANTVNIVTPPVGPITANTMLEFDYRYVNYTGYPATATPLGAGDKLEVQVSTDGTTFDTVYTIDSSNHVTSTAFATCGVFITHAKTAAAGDIIKVKLLATWANGDYYLDIDNVSFRHVAAQPVISVTPAEKDFGTVNLNTASTAQIFTIKNVGGGTLTIDPAVVLSGDDADQFELTDVNSYPCALDANESITVSVIFAPTTEGLKSAKLKIVDDLAKNLTEVPLSGTGFDATIDTFPYSEGFDAVAFPPVGWTNYSVDKTTHAHVETGYWSRKTTGTYNSTAGAAFINYNYSSARYACLQMPAVNIPSSHRLSFYWRDNDSKVAAHDTTYCEISTDGGTSWTLLATLSPAATQSTYQKVDVGLNPYAGNGRLIRFRDATDASYSAWGTYLDEIAIQEGYDYPAGEPVVIGGETITVTGGSANNGTGEIPPVNNASFVTESSYVLQLIGTGPWTITIETTAPWGAYYQGGQWNSVQNIGGFITIIINGGKDAEIPVVLGDSDPTLPVELSSFTATITTDLCVKIAWIAQTETNHSGYNILRAEANDLTNAIKINPVLIDNGTPLGTQISYSYTDVEAYSNMVYYYWLESIALDGVSEYFGPLSVTIGDPSQPPLPPAIPMFTKLMNAFPNPFNPNTNLRYSLKEAGKVNISIYNVKGQLIKSFQNDHTTPGYYQVSWDGRDMNGKPVSSGIYMYRMTSGKYSEAKKMILAK